MSHTMRVLAAADRQLGGVRAVLAVATERGEIRDDQIEWATKRVASALEELSKLRSAGASPTRPQRR